MTTAFTPYAFMCLAQKSLVCLVWPGYKCSISALDVEMPADKANSHGCEAYGVIKFETHAETTQGLHLLALLEPLLSSSHTCQDLLLFAPAFLCQRACLHGTMQCQAHTP